MVKIYLEGLTHRIKKFWDKLGQTPKKLEKKLVSEDALKEEAEKAKEGREKFEAEPNWNLLQALGRDVFGNPSFSDFATSDDVLGSSRYADSINNTYTLSGGLINTQTFEFFGEVVENVTVANSTNNSDFVTGILWDTGHGGNNYNGSQEIIFITSINKNAVGFDDVYDFEIRISATLREYRTIDTEKVVFYTEIK